MNKRPVSYLQTDPRWKSVRLACSGGTMSVGGGGCGPTSAAMLIETLTGRTCLPTETFRWCCEHGYMYANQGTAYDYFYNQFKARGIDCGILTWVPCMSVTSPVRTQVEKKLREGYYFIALMKKGLWTKGGHYVVVWWADDAIHINDPASTSAPRTRGAPSDFWSTAKYFWWVDARAYNNPPKPEESEDEDMDISKLTGEECYEILLKANEYAGKLAEPVDAWADDYRAAKAAGITDGKRPYALCTKLESAMMAYRAARDA